MRLDQFCEITRSHGTRHLHAIAEIFEANIATYADGAPLPWKICEQQKAEAMQAIQVLRAIVCQPVLEANSRAMRSAAAR